MEPRPVVGRGEPIEGRPLRYSFWAGALTVRGSVTLSVLPDVLGFGLIATVVVVLAHVVKRWYGVDLAVPVGPFEAAGAVLGLLLVLRTNAGYDRWWEARKLWGSIVNQSRNLASIALASGLADLSWRSRLVRHTAALPYAVRDQLRARRDLPEIRRLLGEREATRIADAGHMPGMVTVALDRLLREAREHGMEEMAYQQAQQQRAGLTDHLGGCERILKTPLARASAIQVRRFLLMFLGSLPFALLNEFEISKGPQPFLHGVRESGDWLVPLFVMLMAYPLLSLDRIGMELQNPFDTRRVDHLPLDEICGTIERNLLELLEDSVRSDGVDLPARGPVQGTGSLSEETSRDPRDTLIS